MLKIFLVAAAILIASPAIVFAQDIFWSFDSASAVDQTPTVPGTSGTAYIFSAASGNTYNSIDLNFTSSDSSVVLLTGGISFNDPFNIIGGTAFNSSVVTVDAGSGSGNLFAANITQNGINPLIDRLFNPHFDSNVGPNGAVLLAEVNYDIVGSGAATLDFSLGPQGITGIPDFLRIPSFESGTFVGVPEPSSLALLMLGSVGLVA